MRARDVYSSSNRASAVRRARAAPLSSSRASRPRARRDGDESTERDDDGRGAAARRLMDALMRDEEGDIEGVRRVIRMNPAPRPLLDAIEDGMFSHTHWRRRGVPNVENAAHHSCNLALSRSGRRMRCRQSNRFLADLFLKIEKETESEISLNRFDLFHSHVFSNNRGRCGILFHAKEYPAKDENFDVNLGYCQIGSSLRFDENKMRLRNLLWLSVDRASSVLALLDTHKREDLLVVPELHTTFEGDWGDIKADVFYFHGLANRKPHERLFIFPR